jgi:catechol 2,3-dioxygenase-like lactoylglutathione lyase family enzyme
MLNDATPMPTIAVRDLAKAREFYSSVLGLTLKDERTEEQRLIFTSGQGGIEVYVSSVAGTNKATYASWEVADVEAVVDDLSAKGVTFEHYPDMPGLTLEGDIHVGSDGKAAWFTDPDGNILCVHSGA